jgi:hypothetical protein
MTRFSVTVIENGFLISQEGYETIQYVANVEDISKTIASLLARRALEDKPYRAMATAEKVDSLFGKPYFK